MTKLWLVERDRKNLGYDENDGFVIRAASAQAARKIAADAASGEGHEVWLDKDKSKVTLVKEKGLPDIILCSFRAG